jgi:hypothetical protein
MTGGWPQTDLGPRRYIAVAALAALAILGVPASFFFWAYSQGRLVAPALSGNVCLDEKVRFLRDSPTKQCDVLVIGSSMALNNIDSEALLKHLPAGTRFLNAGAYNMKISQTRALLDCLLAVYRPRSVIFVCGLMDFNRTPGPTQFFDTNEVIHFINGSSAWVPTLLRHFDLQYYIDWSFRIPQIRSTRKDYFSVMFDACGSIPLEISFPKVDERRWNLKVDPQQLDPAEYEELARVADVVRSKGLNLICIQPPMRRGSVPVGSATAVDEHWRRMERTLASRGFHLWNLNAIGLSDEYFADYSHLNERGVVPFSEMVGRELDSQWARHGFAATQTSPTR